MIDVDRVRAIDVHTHAEVALSGHDPMPPELRQAAGRYFKDGGGKPTVALGNGAQLAGRRYGDRAVLAAARRVA